jgi:hypothetical protein
MTRLKWSSLVGGLALLLSQAVYAQTVIKLNPKESKSLTNHMMWTLNATCSLQASGTQNKVLISVLEHEGKVNGKKVAKGHPTALNVAGSKNISVSADPGATVHLVNMGDHSVEAVCYN